MVFRGRHTNNGTTSPSWFMVAMVSMVVVVGVKPSPFPAYEEENLPYPMPPRRSAAPEGEVIQPVAYNDEEEQQLQPQQVVPYPEELDYGTNNPDRFAEIVFDRRSESNKNLQQFLRSFPLVMGGSSTSDRVLPLSWTNIGGSTNSLEEANFATHQGRGTSGVSPSLSKGATLTHLTYSEPRPKRVTNPRRRRHIRYCLNWLKICPFK